VCGQGLQQSWKKNNNKWGKKFLLFCKQT
jgi:hypothetical protein